MSTGTILTQASAQWASRPDDQRFLTLEDLRTAVATRKEQSWTAVPESRSLRVVAEDNSLRLNVYDPTAGEVKALELSNWSFGQLAQLANAPASYLRKLPPVLAAINTQYGLEHMPQRDDPLLLAQSNGSQVLRAITGSTYGRIWDLQVVDAVIKANSDGRWVIPSASYTTSNPKRATTLYASDRDVFVFLVDPKNEIEVDGEKLYRGFMVWNSEVGAATFGLTTFLYRYVCDNRIVWGATDIKEIRIRHTGGAPERFAHEGERFLARYAEESTARLITQIKAAKDFDLESKALNTGKGETVASWLQDRGFSKAVAKAAVDTATAEEGKARSLWDIVQGVTAYARSVTHTDARVELETKAGALLTKYVNN